MADADRRQPQALVAFPRAVAEAILTHAAGSPDEEVCGLIGGEGGMVRAAYPARNAAADRRQHFDMEPRSQLAAMRAMAEQGEDLLGIYHSHVEAPAYPSATDLALHAYPDALYVIAAPHAAVGDRLRAFFVAGDQVTEVRLQINDG
jgi:proteasome lid subunit RPN8/RPN11